MTVLLLEAARRRTNVAGRELKATPMDLRKTFAIAAGLGMALGSRAAADFVTLFPSKDNTLVQVQQGSTQLSNGLGDIFTGRTNQDGQAPATISIRRGLIRFDIAGSVPAGATITGVSLTMWDVRGLNGSQSVNLHRVLSDWGQGTSFFNGGVGGPATQDDATWFSRFFDAADPPQSPGWATPGGDFAPAVSASTIITEHASDNELAFSWAGSTGSLMVADVQSWLDDPSGNFGWLIRGNEAAGQTAKRFRSGEGAAQFRPTLQVTFTAVPEPGAMTLAAIGGALMLAARRRLARA
jgi:hypothetical protein